jgi:hypothetical protein
VSPEAGFRQEIGLCIFGDANAVGGRQRRDVDARGMSANRHARAMAHALLRHQLMLTMLIVLAALSGDAEVARVQAHLAGAEAQLRAADVTALSPQQRARRAHLIDQLAAYRERGEFPRNLDFAERTPYFIDDRGVRCAMAHLIEQNGGAALVARVAATANNARVAELAADPELLAWLRHHGMTVAEAARVQPAYTAPPAVSAAITPSARRAAAAKSRRTTRRSTSVCLSATARSRVTPPARRVRPASSAP